MPTHGHTESSTYNTKHERVDTGTGVDTYKANIHKHIKFPDLSSPEPSMPYLDCLGKAQWMISTV